ncbi:uncharacterized protein LOC110249975 [Exaiptasia diaphana]|uniref:LicD/FKTN/FKRP nucleotidyltransferase domain-containing protein n=1 Tax=Exaiptasia diaphana TaxID=2652724 RepID=A0A913Y0N4_EXADI|nr:uncharacterized protein LOC110249975 [Exaiptasia diaphana]KXJ23769.1 Uncharacterized protein RT0683 [Exaiptasia diaphana]
MLQSLRFCSARCTGDRNSPNWRNTRTSERTVICKRTTIFTIIVVGFIYYEINVHNFSWYTNNSGGPCKISKKDMMDLLSLSQDTSIVLNRLKINHFLVYGSLWGGLRNNGPLPWDTDFDFGIFYNEIIKYSEQEVKDKFKAFDINCYYSYRFGFYRVTRGSARGDLMIFRDYYNNGWMHRIGVEAYLAFVNYRKFHVFPAHLVKLPLDSSPFGRVNVSIPHGGVEIQRYFYPHDWWKISKPGGCINHFV